MNKKYDILESIRSDTYGIRLNEEPYEGIEFSFGKVQFLPNDDEDVCTLSFEYDIIDDKQIQYDLPEFEQYIGKILESLIMESLKKNEVVYTGGTDENRNEDPDKSDSQ